MIPKCEQKFLKLIFAFVSVIYPIAANTRVMCKFAKYIQPTRPTYSLQHKQAFDHGVSEIFVSGKVVTSFFL